jgi:hypothetical protein
MDKMKWTLKNSLWPLVCLVSYLLALWICVVNIQEIADRAGGRYTIFSQRTSLSEGGAVVYLGLWTLVFIVLSILSIKNLSKKRARRAGIYSIVLILLFVVSNFVDNLFYLQLG